MAILLILICVALLLLIGVAVAGSQARQRQMLQDWLKAARATGLDARQFGANEYRAHGVLHDVPIQANLKLDPAGKEAYYRSIVWAKSGSIPRNLALRPEPALAPMTRWMGGPDVPIGDAAFDDRIELPALDAHICAALTHRARLQVTQLLGWGGYVADGTVVCRSMWSAEHNAALKQLLVSVAALARQLSVTTAEVPQRLADNARNDPAPAVRLENFRYLCARETRSPPELLAKTAAALLGDDHAPVRLLAAGHAGEAGHAVLRALAADADLDLSVRTRAAEALGRHPIPDLAGLVALLVSAHPPEIICAALGTIGTTSDAALLEAVLDCAHSEHESVRAAAARALGSIGHPHTEPVLIALLSDASSDVQHTSAEALGLFASVAAVEPLLPLAQSLVRPRVRQAARGAIGRIQARLGDVEAGRVSLSDPHHLAGAVDVVDTSAALRVGDVSLVEEDVSPTTPTRRDRAE